MTTPTSAHRTPKGVKGNTCPEPILSALKAAHTPDKGLKGADIMRAIRDAKGVEDPEGSIARMRKANNPGLVLRTYMRSHGAYVGRGGTYGMTVAEAAKVAAGFIAGVSPREAWFQGEVRKADDAA